MGKMTLKGLWHYILISDHKDLEMIAAVLRLRHLYKRMLDIATDPKVITYLESQLDIEEE